MQILRNLLPLFLASSLFTACNVVGWNTTIQGKGPFTENQRQLGSFDRISLSGGMELDVVVGNEQSVVVHANGNLQEHIRTRIEGSTLKIDFTESVSCNGKLRAVISVPSLVGIEISGSSRLNVSHIASDDFYLDVSGSVGGVLEGKTGNLEVEISGSGKLEAFALQAQRVYIDVSGSGRLEVNASVHLDVNVSGSVDVTYYGKPDVNIDQSGSARVRAARTQAL
jgi:hypothetical protein